MTRAVVSNSILCLVGAHEWIPIKSWWPCICAAKLQSPCGLRQKYQSSGVAARLRPSMMELEDAMIRIYHSDFLVTSGLVDSFGLG